MRWALLIALASCRTPSQPSFEYMADMVDPVPYEAFSDNPVLRGGVTIQPPAPGTIARGSQPFVYGPGPSEALRAGLELANPIARSPEVVERGRNVFQRICTPCHGPSGQGDGPIIPRFPSPPSLVAPHAKSLPDGQIVHIINRGQGLMPSHAAQVSWADRWKVVHFLRSLQEGGKP